MADERVERIAEFIKPLRVKPGSKVNLGEDFDPGYKADYLKEKDGVELLKTGTAMLADYQARLAAQDTHGVLVCLQALDAGGKDGTIRHVMSGVNPQGVRVSGFKVPSAEEFDHDYLWRYARRLPARGEIGIFNRSHYEEVLVVRVHPFLKRIDRPEKNWKFSGADARERRAEHETVRLGAPARHRTAGPLGARQAPGPTQPDRSGGRPLKECTGTMRRLAAE